MTRYEVLKVLHVVAAVIWVGGALAVQWYQHRLARRRTNSVDEELTDAEFFGYHVFIPAAVVSFASGLGMAAEGGWRFETFMIIGIIMWLVAMVTGAAYLGPQTAKLRSELASGPSLSADRRLRRIRLVSATEDYLLVAVVVVMVVRPWS